MTKLPSQELLRLRAEALWLIRNYFRSQGFLEVDTPLRIAAPAPEANIDHFAAEGAYLASSPELEMKRLLAKGCGNCFQLTRSFRKGEAGRKHLTEFTILEWYRVGEGTAALQRDCEQLISSLARTLLGTTQIARAGLRLDLAAPWTCTTVEERFMQLAGWNPLDCCDEFRFSDDLDRLIEPSLQQPGFLCEYPAWQCSLARLIDQRRADRFELYIAGLELANGFAELADPIEQRKRFLLENLQRQKAGKPAYPLPEAFLTELTSLPPCAGIALGVDRLLMILSGAEDIRQVMFEDAE